MMITDYFFYENWPFVAKGFPHSVRDKSEGGSGILAVNVSEART
jgi:hypothetical protein